MTEQAEVGHLTITAFFGRKVGLPNYSNVEASVFIQRDIPLGSNPETITEATQGAFTLAKCMVLDELGLPYTLNEETNLVVEVVPVVAVAAKPKARAKAAAAPVASSEAEAALEAAFGGAEEVVGDYDGNEGGATADVRPINDNVIPLNSKGKPEKWWLENRFLSHPDEFYDNRAKKAAGEYKKTSPDVKHIKTGEGVWFERKSS